MEKALVGAFSVITNLRKNLRCKLYPTHKKCAEVLPRDGARAGWTPTSSSSCLQGFCVRRLIGVY